MSTQLSRGIVAQYNMGQTDFTDQPVVQVLSFKLLPNQKKQNQERYKILISDGVLHMHALTGQNMNNYFTNNQIVPNTIIKITDAMIGDVQGKQILFILKLEILDNKINYQIGNPQPVSQGTGTVMSPQHQPVQKQESAPQKQVPQQAPPKTSPQRQVVQNVKQVKPEKKGSSVIQMNQDLSAQPIASLSPYNPNWCIKARLTKKSDLKSWEKKDKGTKGKLMSIDLVDDQNGEIRAVLFNAAAEKQYDMLKEGHVYIIAKGTLKQANKQFSNIKNNYEITLDENSIIEECHDDTNIPQIKYTLTPLGDLNNFEENAIVDVIGVVTQVGEFAEILSKKTQKPFKKRTVQISDNSNGEKTSVELVLWGDIAEKDIELNSVILAKGVKKSNFNNVSLGTISSSTLLYNPEVDASHDLMKWFNEEGKNATSKTLSQKRESTSTFTVTPLGEIKNMGIGHSEKGDFINVRGTITYIKKENLWYESCPSQKGEKQCQKKVVKNENTGTYRCESCNQEFDHCNYRYLFTCIVNDFSGHSWTSAFNDIGEELFGCSAKEMHELKMNAVEEFERKIQEANFRSVVFTLRCKEETNPQTGQPNLKCVIFKSFPNDWTKNCRTIIKDLERYQ